MIKIKSMPMPRQAIAIKDGQEGKSLLTHLINPHPQLIELGPVR